jgi:hypothetical protein
MKRPLEQDYTSLVAYTRALEEYCDALAQSEQEPVACIWEKNDGYKSLEWGGLEEDEIQEIGLKSYTPLYTHPLQRTWVGLTDKERSKIWRDVVKWGDPSHDDVDLMKAIEAKLKEKNHV